MSSPVARQATEGGGMALRGEMFPQGAKGGESCKNVLNPINDSLRFYRGGENFSWPPSLVPPWLRACTYPLTFAKGRSLNVIPVIYISSNMFPLKYELHFTIFENTGFYKTLKANASPSVPST